MQSVIRIVTVFVNCFLLIVLTFVSILSFWCCFKFKVFTIPCHQAARMMQMIPGAATLISYDKEYLQDVIFNTRRYSRKSEYVVNLEFTALVGLGNNITISLIFYEYLHNEYRRSFVEIHKTLCQFLEYDQFIGKALRKYGFSTCPIPVGRHHITNFTFYEEFPNIFPFEKGKGELIAKLGSPAKIIAQGDVVITFKQKGV